MAFHPEQEASTCDECESRLVTTGGEIYCEGCGLVTDAQTFDAAPIWKRDDDGRLVGQQHGPPQGLGLGAIFGSVISYGSRDARGKPLSSDPATRARVQRLKRTATRNARDRSIPREAARAVRDLAGKLDQSRAVVDRATFILRGMWKAHETRGRPWSILAAVAIIAASRSSNGGALRAVDLVGLIESNAKRQKPLEHRIGRMYSRLARELNIAHLPPERFVPAAITALGLSHEAERIALRLLRDVPIPVGTSPQGWASGAVYEATFRTNERRGQRELGRVFSVSEVTVRKCFAAFPHEHAPKEAER